MTNFLPSFVFVPDVNLERRSFFFPFSPLDLSANLPDCFLLSGIAVSSIWIFVPWMSDLRQVRPSGALDGPLVPSRVAELISEGRREVVENSGTTGSY